MHLPHPNIVLYIYQKETFVDFSSFYFWISLVGGTFFYVWLLCRICRYQDEIRTLKIEGKDLRLYVHNLYEKFITKSSYEFEKEMNKTSENSQNSEIQLIRVFLQTKHPEFKDLG